jgi:hypothetical protein
MTMRQRFARLFVIKTRTDALLVTYAIAVGAIERGFHYMDQYPGFAGVLLALACLGVPFIAGAKLVDSVKPVAIPAASRLLRPRRRAEDRRSRRGDYQGARRLAPAPRIERRRG